MITTPQDGTLTASARPVIAGTAEAQSSVRIYDLATLLGSAQASADGAWSFTPAADLADGEHPITATATDAANNTSEPSAAVTIVIDSTAPSEPTIVTPAAGAAVDTARPVLTGTAEPGATVEVYDGETLLGSTVSGADGNWSFQPGTDLSEGEHQLSARATDPAGNRGDASAVVSVIVDTETPSAPVITAPADGAITNDPSVTVVGTAEATCSVEVLDGVTLVGTATADDAGAWGLDLVAALSEGPTPSPLGPPTRRATRDRPPRSPRSSSTRRHPR